MTRVRASWHSKIEWYCCYKLLHVTAGWKSFNEDIPNPEDVTATRDLGTSESWGKQGKGAKPAHVIVISLYPLG